MEPFYPIPFIFDGWFDPWLWGAGPIALSILVSSALYLVVWRVRKSMLWPSERVASRDVQSMDDFSVLE